MLLSPTSHPASSLCLATLPAARNPDPTANAATAATQHQHCNSKREPGDRIRRGEFVDFDFLLEVQLAASTVAQPLLALPGSAACRQQPGSYCERSAVTTAMQ
eukprot:scpid104240/ scgid9964/ 